jgi:hypothetical protein
MNTVDALIETEMAAAINNAELAELAGVTAYPGQSDGTRPDKYVSVVATAVEPRGSSSLVTLEFRAVAYKTELAWLKAAQGAIYLWAMDDASPLYNYSANSLVIMGHGPGNFRNEVREQQRAEIVSFKVGASVDI